MADVAETQQQAAVSGRDADEPQPADNPAGLSWRTWTTALKRTFSGYQSKNLSDWAAALTYYGILAMFPAIIALLSIVGLVGHSATQPLIDNLGEAGSQRRPGHLHQRDRGPREGSRRRRRSVRDRHRRCAVGGVELRGSVHARLERDL